MAGTPVVAGAGDQAAGAVGIGITRPGAVSATIGTSGVVFAATDRPALDAQFALIREYREWLRSGRELGFGGLADPQSWLDRLEGVGPVLEPREFLDAATLLDTAAWLKPQFKEDAAKFPLLAARAASLADFRDLLAAIRRAILPNAEISDDASPTLRRIRALVSETRTAIQKSLRQILRARNADSS